MPTSPLIGVVVNPLAHYLCLPMTPLMPSIKFYMPKKIYENFRLKLCMLLYGVRVQTSTTEFYLKSQTIKRILFFNFDIFNLRQNIWLFYHTENTSISNGRWYACEHFGQRSRKMFPCNSERDSGGMPDLRDIKSCDRINGWRINKKKKRFWQKIWIGDEIKVHNVSQWP